MKTYYLRVEGVNLANFVYDTNDLNTVRGCTDDQAGATIGQGDRQDVDLEAVHVTGRAASCCPFPVPARSQG